MSARHLIVFLVGLVIVISAVAYVYVLTTDDATTPATPPEATTTAPETPGTAN